MSHDVIPERRYKLTSRLVLALGALMMVSGFSGCNIISGINDYVTYNTPAEDFVSGWRDKVWANRAYNARREQFDPPPYEAHFRAGFIAGYRNISQGGQGCTPSLPPRTYWSWRYQSAEGQAKVAAWFSGFPHGARAAEEDGVGNYYQIQVANWVDQNDADRECVDCGPDDPWDPRMWSGEGIEEIPQGYEGEMVPIPEDGASPTPALPPDTPIQPPQTGGDDTASPTLPDFGAPATGGIENGGVDNGGGPGNNVPLSGPSAATWNGGVATLPEVEVPTPQLPVNAGPYTSSGDVEPIQNVSWDRFPALDESTQGSTRRSEPLMNAPSSLPTGPSQESPRTGMVPSYPRHPAGSNPGRGQADMNRAMPNSRMPSLIWPNNDPIPTSSAVTQSWPRPGIYR